MKNLLETNYVPVGLGEKTSSNQFLSDNKAKIFL